jgi:hypothetical protein
MYRFMKGEYFKAEQVCFFQSQNRLFQIGWKKNAIRELTRVITSGGSRDEYNLEERECDTVVVGKLLNSRMNFCCLVNDERVYLIGGYDEYKKKYIS